jgi:hypothetical protein
MIRLGGLVSQKAFGKFEMGKVISNPFANAFVNEAEGEDHEVSMANNSLDTIIKMATELKAKMGENEKDIPAWIQDHITNAENFISQAASNYHEYGQNESVNEGAGREAMGIAGFTGTRGIAVQKFIDDFNLNAKKLFNFISKGKLKDRMDFATAISGKPGNKYQGNFVGMFGEGTINEDSETKRLEMLIKNLEETNKLLVQQLKDTKSLPSNKKENIKKSIALNLDLINYYKKWLKDYESAATESVNEASPCWKGYKQVGMKDKGGRQVPNCVPNESIVKEGRSVKSIQTDYLKTIDTIQKELVLYKKHKDTPQAKKHVENLKKLNVVKNKLQNELDDSLYDDPFASKAKTQANRDIGGNYGPYNYDFD